MLTKELQIAERARKYKGEGLTNLHQFIDYDWMIESYRRLNRRSSPGVDGKDWREYGQDLQANVEGLLSAFKSGKYRAPSIRRVYIPKGNGEKRPLGIPTIEDKVLQESVRRVLTPVYEEEFKPFSYGFRSGRGAHDAIDYLFRQVSYEGMHYIIDADIKDYFGSIDHGMLRGFLDRRVKDGVIRRAIGKWLKAGILEDKQIRYPKEGTPQGGVISPLLSNIYLHYVLDEWFSEEIQPLLRGKSFIVRYADDFILGFANAYDARRVMEVLPKRFKKYNLTLHAEKTKLINLDNKRGEGARSFDFLGFTHYLGKSRKGKMVLQRKTSRKKMQASLHRIQEWIRHSRKGTRELILALNVKLRGYYNYYGITFNSRRLHSFYYLVKRILHKWLNRRGGKPVWNWERFSKLITEWIPLLTPRLYHTYLSAKPV
jgi:group II intron reverse transcriptase/maturase